MLCYVNKASFSEQRSVASYTSVINRMSRIASPTSPTTLSPATACVVEYFPLHCLSNVRSVIYYLCHLFTVIYWNFLLTSAKSSNVSTITVVYSTF
nr:unnamed protein product [Callosobruchus chinensis]